MKSPLGSIDSVKLRDLSKDYILAELERYYDVRPPRKIVECDYSMWRCTETGLEFASPMVPGNASFYEWLSGFESYYPGFRWEYGKVQSLLQSDSGFDSKAAKVADVGCGKGDFLRGLRWLPPEQRYALDLNEPAVRACEKEGFQAFCGTVDAASQAGFLKSSEFEVVTSFHCLEHVENPVEFVRSLANLVTPGGRLFLSTPYSPMSFESEWFDILNHPPHHMTRWNLRAYKKLAAMLNLEMRWFCPTSSPFRRAHSVFKLVKYGPNRHVNRGTQMRDLLRSFPQFLRFYRKQLQRAAENGGVSADLILVEMRPS